MVFALAVVFVFWLSHGNFRGILAVEGDRCCQDILGKSRWLGKGESSF